MAADEDIGRRTRSQAAPDWSPTAELILVNEIAAVEADCHKALSSYQKWKIIAENCAAQDVSRSLNQYRRKWDSLLQEYNIIKKWESRSRRDSYWSLKPDRREELGLPRSFDDELFAAIGNVIRDRENQSDSEPDSDGEAKAEIVDADKELGAETDIHKHAKGSKRKRRQFTSQEKRAWKNLVEEDPSECLAKEKPSKGGAKRKPPRSHAEKNPMQSFMEQKFVRPEPDEEKPQLRSTKKMPRKGQVKEKAAISIEEKEKINEENAVRTTALEEERLQRPQTSNADPVKEETVSSEDEEQMIASILRENAKRISAIVAEDSEYKAENAGSVDQDCQTKSVEFVRNQGDKLIACLGDIVKTLDQLCNLVPRM